MKIVIAIPCYNCARQLPRVLDGIDAALAARVHEIWVIDNGSTDGTVEAAVAYASGGRLPNLRVFRNRQNVNLGGTHKAAFMHARAEGATHVLILHGDDQARASEAADLIEIAQKGPTQTVLGSRFSRHSRLYGYDRKRIAGNRVLNVSYSMVAGRRLQDLGSGLNLFALDDLDPETYLGFGNRLSFNYELILDLVRRKVQFAFFPITWSESDQVSNARNVKIFKEALRILARWRSGSPTNEDAADVRTLEYEWDEVSPPKVLQVVMPMGGLGQRFRTVGIDTPKPLIPVDGAPMFRKALASIDAYPGDQRVVAIIRSDDDAAWGIGDAIRAARSDTAIVHLEHNTRGAVDTVLHAREFLDPASPLMILDCDIAFVSDDYFAAIQRAMSGESDAVLLSFRSTDPRYSFAKVGDGRQVTATAEKNPISDRALMGAYFFARADDFLSAADELMNRQLSAETAEYFVSLVYNILIEGGKRVELATGTFYSFGTPDELDSYVTTGQPVGLA